MAEQTQPNVLLVSTDHWPGSLLGCEGHPAVMTPTLDQLATNGVRFTNAYSECPVCVPARRTLMSGLKPHDHGMLSNGHMPMPEVPTLAQAFRDAGYQAYGVGKLHVQPQRQRLGFDDVLIDEEGRGSEGCRADDYELYLADHGHAGERFAGGMCNNQYVWRPWHLDEHLHATNWTAKQMARQIIRRDPLKPAFWYMSFSHPHPPLAPLRDYVEMYRNVEVPDPHFGDWSSGPIDQMALAVHNERQRMQDMGFTYTEPQIRDIRRAFYAQCTHIDHQLRVVLGTLSNEGLMKNTIICFISDHGDMLGNHGLWAKQWFYDDSARVPMILVGTQAQASDGTVGHHRVDDRLVGLADVMPTLLHLAGIDPPGHCQGRSMVGDDRREYLHGAWGAAGTNRLASRMIRDPRYKLVFFPEGPVVQLFDMVDDPLEQRNLADDPAHAQSRAKLERWLIDELRDEEQQWVRDGRLVGNADAHQREPRPYRGLCGQRGVHMPSPRIGVSSW